jgi:hypothetical protein
MKPTEFIGEKVSYDQAGQMIFGHKGDKLQLLLDVRGWGAIQHLFKTEKEAADFQDAVGEWYAEAINEKLQNRTSDLLKQNEELREALKIIRDAYYSDGEFHEEIIADLKSIAREAITKAEER